MPRLWIRAIKDLWDNRFLSAATITTIALAVLTVGTFGLIFFNAEAVMNSWKLGIRMMVYLNAAEPNAHRSVERFLNSLAGVERIQYIPKDEALKILRKQLNRQKSILDGLSNNPLPDAFEVRFAPDKFQQEDVESIAVQIEKQPEVASVEYGKEWFHRVSVFFNLFKMGGYVLGGVLALATILIVANTIRIVLYTRKDEIDIMRLVGATDTFIKSPYYLQGIIQGAMGSLIGIASLYIGYLSISTQIKTGFTAGAIDLRFLSNHFIGGISITCMVVGWAGSIISLKQFLKT